MTCVVKCLPFHQINLDKCVLDERIKKDLVDYIQYRIETSPNIQVNITPVHLANAASKFLQQDSQIGPQERFLQHLIQICAGMYICMTIVSDGIVMTIFILIFTISSKMAKNLENNEGKSLLTFVLSARK